jgi:hypothetical protein
MAASARLLEVSVIPCGFNRWKWSVMDRETEIACGYELSRKEAQTKGDAALFMLLSVSHL